MIVDISIDFSHLKRGHLLMLHRSSKKSSSKTIQKQSTKTPTHYNFVKRDPNVPRESSPEAKKSLKDFKTDDDDDFELLPPRPRSKSASLSRVKSQILDVFASFSMGNTQMKPNVDKDMASGELDNLRWASVTMQGYPRYQEDRSAVIESFDDGPLKNHQFFGVFDGHAGHLTSQICSEELALVIESVLKQQSQKDGVSEGDIERAIDLGFVTMDEKLKERLIIEEDHSGSTAVCALMDRRNIHIAHSGDSRAILVGENGIIYSTEDHKPENKSELRRIMEAGAVVLNHRVNGSLALARAIGDFDFKWLDDQGPEAQAVTCKPDIQTIALTGHEQFMILACDGIWDVMTNEEAVDFVRHRLRCTRDLTQICSEMVDNCLFRGSYDNLTCLIVLFKQNYEPFDQKAADDDYVIDCAISKMVEQVMEDPVAKEHVKDVFMLMNILLPREIDGLPPGGCLGAKFAVVQNSYKVRRVSMSLEQKDRKRSRAKSFLRELGLIKTIGEHDSE